MNPSTQICTKPDCKHREWRIESDQFEVWIALGHGKLALTAHEPLCPSCDPSGQEISRQRTFDPVAVEHSL